MDRLLSQGLLEAQGTPPGLRSLQGDEISSSGAWGCIWMLGESLSRLIVGLRAGIAGKGDARSTFYVN